MFQAIIGQTLRHISIVSTGVLLELGNGRKFDIECHQGSKTIEALSLKNEVEGAVIKDVRLERQEECGSIIVFKSRAGEQVARALVIETDQEPIVVYWATEGATLGTGTAGFSHNNEVPHIKLIERPMVDHLVLTFEHGGKSPSLPFRLLLDPSAEKVEVCIRRPIKKGRFDFFTPAKKEVVAVFTVTPDDDSMEVEEIINTGIQGQLSAGNDHRLASHQFPNGTYVVDPEHQVLYKTNYYDYEFFVTYSYPGDEKSSFMRELNGQMDAIMRGGVAFRLTPNNKVFAQRSGGVWEDKTYYPRGETPKPAERKPKSYYRKTTVERVKY